MVMAQIPSRAFMKKQTLYIICIICWWRSRCKALNRGEHVFVLVQPIEATRWLPCGLRTLSDRRCCCFIEIIAHAHAAGGCLTQKSLFRHYFRCFSQRPKLASDWRRSWQRRYSHSVVNS